MLGKGYALLFVDLAGFDIADGLLACSLVDVGFVWLSDVLEVVPKLCEVRYGHGPVWTLDDVVSVLGCRLVAFAASAFLFDHLDALGGGKGCDERVRM